MVGRLGTAPLAALGSNGALFNCLFFLFFTALAVICTQAMAAAHARGDGAGVGRGFVQALAAMAAVSAGLVTLLTAAPEQARDGGRAGVLPAAAALFASPAHRAPPLGFPTPQAPPPNPTASLMHPCPALAGAAAVCHKPRDDGRRRHLPVNQVGSPDSPRRGCPGAPVRACGRQARPRGACQGARPPGAAPPSSGLGASASAPDAGPEWRVLPPPEATAFGVALPGPPPSGRPTLSRTYCMPNCFSTPRPRSCTPTPLVGPLPQLDPPSPPPLGPPGR
jgi:hypothetical protein